MTASRNVPSAWAAGDDVGDPVVRLADLGQVRLAERVRRARDLDDDHLHQVAVVAVGVDDERRDRERACRARRSAGRRSRRSPRASAPSARANSVSSTSSLDWK